MADEPKPNSERARKRAMAKIRRETLIERREAYFDLLVSGYSSMRLRTTPASRSRG
jgi:hypothetical protein